MRRQHWRAVWAIGAAVLMMVWWHFGGTRPPRGTLHRIFESPDARFSILVYKSPPALISMPGQSSDGPGVVCLVKSSTGKILKRSHATMFREVDEVWWSTNSVLVSGFDEEWDLPEWPRDARALRLTMDWQWGRRVLPPASRRIDTTAAQRRPCTNRRVTPNPPANPLEFLRGISLWSWRCGPSGLKGDP